MPTIRLNVSVDGAGRILERVRQIEKDAEEARTPATSEMAQRTAEEMERRIREPKSGRQYPQYPRPSGVSGGYPAYQWGGLVGSIDTRVTAMGNASLTVGSGLPRPYALFLELGWATKDGSYHIFPFIRPTVESLRDEYTGIVRAEVAKHIR